MTPRLDRALLTKQWPHVFEYSDRLVRSEFSEAPDELGFKIEISLLLMNILSDFLDRRAPIDQCILGLRSFFRPACGRADRASLLIQSLRSVDLSDLSASEVFDLFLKFLILIFFDLKFNPVRHAKILETSGFIAPNSVRKTRVRVARALKTLEYNLSIGAGYPHLCSSARYVCFLEGAEPSLLRDA